MLLWLTDIHLNCLPLPSSAEELGKYLRFENPGLTGVVLTGDICEGPLWCETFNSFLKGIGVPVYFVAGNHDYVGSGWMLRGILWKSYEGTQARYLPLEGPIEFPTFTLVGVDGWYDASYGNPFSDYSFGEWWGIQELIPGAYYKPLLIEICRKKAIGEAARLESYLKSAVKLGKPIVVATHVPPYPEASLYEGNPSPRESLPWFVNGNLGMLLRDFAEAHPDLPVTVLCGHTHSKASFEPLPNLTVLVGGACYGNPEVSGLIYPETAEIKVL